MQLCSTRSENDTITVTARPHTARTAIGKFDVVIHIYLAGNFIERYRRIAAVIYPRIYFKVCGCEHRIAEFTLKINALLVLFIHVSRYFSGQSIQITDCCLGRGKRIIKTVYCPAMYAGDKCICAQFEFDRFF